MTDIPKITTYVELPLGVVNVLIEHQRSRGRSTDLSVAVRAAAVERARQLQSDAKRAAFLTERRKPTRKKKTRGKPK